jgi:hypothetical protein
VFTMEKKYKSSLRPLMTCHLDFRLRQFLNPSKGSRCLWSRECPQRILTIETYGSSVIDLVSLEICPTSLTNMQIYVYGRFTYFLKQLTLDDCQ